MDNFTGALFTGKSLNGLDSGFKQKLEAMAKAFREYVIAGGKNWEPILISSALRSDEEQLNAMMDLIPTRGGLTGVYGSITIGPLMPIIDDSIVSNRTHHSYETALKYYKSQNDREVLAFLGVITDMKNSRYEREDSVKKILRHLLSNSSRYGYISSHRMGKAVDISGRYPLVGDLEDFFRKKGDSGLKIKGNYDDRHLHLGL